MGIARLLLVAWLLPASAWATPAAADVEPTPAAAAVDGAAALLSRYPAGTMPVEPTVMGAIHTIAEHGDRGDVSLLRNLVVNERPEIQLAASEAIARVRDRQVDRQREAFAQTLPDWPELAAAAKPYRREGLGREEAVCVAYVDLVLGSERVAARKAAPGDAALLLATGQPGAALAATADQPSTDARMLAARAREELGDVRGALREYATLAADGHEPAREALDRYGIDSERLLLGLLAHPTRLLDHDEERTLDQLVRHGEDLTVTVLAERSRLASPSDRASATDALARMLDEGWREEPLPLSGRGSARRALVTITRIAPDGIGDIALEALADAP